MYRENIAEFVENGILFIPKNGGLNTYVKELLNCIGVDANGIVTRGEKKVKLELMLVRGEDIAQRVWDCLSKGQNAYGLTGDDLFDEFKLETNDDTLQVLNTYDWVDETAQFGRPALCLLTKTGTWGPITDKNRIAINKKYQKTSLKFLEEESKKRGITLETVAYSGDTEQTVGITTTGCIEIVYTGEKSATSALSKNGLRIAEKVRFSDISLIGAKQPDIWEVEYRRILARANNPTDSYTSKLLADENKIRKKIGEESAEFVSALCGQGSLIGEAADIVYAVMVGLAAKKTPWSELKEEIKRRGK